MALDITSVPFNKFLGIERASAPGFLLQLGDSTNLHNHLQTVHASAQLALAEATSGECLLQHFPDLGSGVLAVVRRLEAKFRNPLRGRILSRATIQQDIAEKLLETL